MTAITDAAQGLEDVLGAEPALKERAPTDVEARTAEAARPHIQELGRLIDEANQIERQGTHRKIKLTLDEISARKTAAITYYTTQADHLEGLLTQVQCIFLLRIALANRNSVVQEHLLSSHQSLLSNDQIIIFACDLRDVDFNSFLQRLDSRKFFALYPELTKRPGLRQALLTKSLEILASNTPASNEDAYATVFELSLALGKFNEASDLILTKGSSSRNLPSDITTLATRLKNTKNHTEANRFLKILPIPLFNQTFPQLFGIFSETAQVKRALFERALDPQVPAIDLFTPASYRAALDFFLTNDLVLAERLIVEKITHSTNPGAEIIDFVNRKKAANEAEAAQFVRTRLSDALFAQCWEELFTLFQNNPTTFNFLVNKALTNGLLTDATFIDAHKSSFDLVFAAWMAIPAHRPEAVNLFRLLEGSLNFYNSFSDHAGVVRRRKSTWARVDFDVGGVRNTTNNILQVDCHHFARNTALIQLYSTLEAFPSTTRVLWVHGAGNHSGPGAALLKDTVPTIWASLNLPIQIVGQQILVTRINAGATVVERT